MEKIKDNYFRLDKFKDGLYNSVVADYVKGGSEVSKKTNTQPVRPRKQEIEQLVQIILESVKGVTEEMSKAIRREIRTSILQKESRSELSKRLDKIFKGDNPTRFRYEDRLKMVARTEKARALNAGSLNTAKEVGAKGKYIQIVQDNRTSSLCKEERAKYGTPEKAIPLDEPFVVMYEGKEIRALYPPFHPNCRSMVLYTFDE